MVDAEQYFTINRTGQYGKTAILQALYKTNFVPGSAGTAPYSESKNTRSGREILRRLL